MRRASKQRQRSGAPAQNAVRVPHDGVNEMVVIAAVIVDEGARRQYLQTIPADIMYAPGHALIWTALQAMDHKGLYYDPATLRQVGGADIDTQYVEGLIRERPVAPPNLKHHVEMLHWDAARVSTAKGAVTSFLEMLKDPKTDPAALRSAAKKIETGLAAGTNHSLRNPRQLVEEQMRVIRSRREGVATYGFGIPGLDFYGPDDYDPEDHRCLDGVPRLVPGTAPGRITVVTGVSGSGKTTATTRGALGMYCAGRRITYGAYEQGSGMTLELMAAFALGISRTALMTGQFDDQDEAEMQEEMERISEYVLFDEIPFERFATRQGNPNARAIDRIAQSIADSKCDVYIADLFKRTLRETDPDDEEHALMMMQQLAKKTGVHLILVQQQKLKDVEATKNKLPRRDSIKGSAAWVEVPDQIIGWHRPALWKNVPDDTIYSLVLKQRDGKWPLMVEHEWDPVFGSVDGGRGVEVQFNDADETEQSDAFWSGFGKKTT